MNHKKLTLKRLALYIVGMFILSVGVSFSIVADLGVSPVSSLAYAFALTTGFSVGLMTVFANVLFIIVQVILNKQFILKESIVQLMISFLFGSFIDLGLLLVHFLPTPSTIVIQGVYLIISLFGVALGLFGYFSAKYPLMPYDELTHVISERFHMEVSKSKVTGDVINVIVAGVLCLIFIQSFGSIGVGTILAELFIGKILGWLTKHY